MAEFQAKEASTGFEDAGCLAQCLVNKCDVTQAECDGVDIEAALFEGKGGCVACYPFEIVDPSLVNGAVASNVQHIGVEVKNGDVGFGGFFLDAEGDVACAACDIEEFHVVLWAYAAHE